ncbi:uncharacterized protein [Dermacentor albipictus]|uniref:uncharacterized protein n=1 Tax=Dermacentor albipictus TaxID=60249 RepID=UPI0038FC3A9B
MAHHQLPKYDDQSDNWKAYITKAEAYFEATGVSDLGKKRALLVAALSTHTVQVLSGQVAPRKPNSLTYEEAVNVLDDYFDPKRHEITESYQFFNRCQLEDDAHIWALTAPSNGRLPPPILRTFTWCGIDVPMIVDTGSPACVVSKEIFEKNREHWPQLEPAFIKLSCYLGKLPVLGKLSMAVCYSNKEVKSSLMVLNCSGPSLCGRELISKFNDAGSSVLNVSVQQSSGPGSSRTPAMHAVLSEFKDVFSPKLGLIDGHPVHLKLKESAMLKFYHQPLVGLLKADRPTPALAAARIQRWALYLGGFCYQLQYSPGPANEADEWPLPEATVYAGNFGMSEKWTPGIVESITGSRMVSIRTPAGSVRRHVDQVRNREDATPPLGKDQEAAK